MSEMDKLRQMAQEHHDLKKLCRRQKKRIAELSTDLQSYTAMHAVQENEIGRLDAALAALSDPDWWDGETISTAMDFARKARAGE